MPSKYGFKTREERQAEQQRKEEAERRLREKEHAEERRREEEQSAAEEWRKQQMLKIAMQYDADVKDVLDDYAVANELPCRAEGPIPIIECWRKDGVYLSGPAEKIGRCGPAKKIVWHACWTLYHKPKVSSSAYYQVAVDLIFSERLKPERFEISGITGGKKEVKLSKRALVEALLDTEPAEQYPPSERLEFGGGY